jgi:hypothetical protein
MGIDTSYRESMRILDRKAERDYRTKKDNEEFRIKNDKMRIENEKMCLEHNKVEREIAEKEEQIREKRRIEETKIEHSKEMVERKESHDYNMLQKKQDYDDNIRKIDRVEAVHIENTKGSNELDRMSHETVLRLQEKELSEKYLESEVDREIFEEHAKTRSNLIAEVVKIVVQGEQNRKTLSLQAKLGQTDIDRGKVKGWIGEVDEE